MTQMVSVADDFRIDFRLAVKFGCVCPGLAPEIEYKPLQNRICRLAGTMSYYNYTINWNWPYVLY